MQVGRFVTILQKFNMQHGAALRWRRFTSRKKESWRILMGCFNMEMEPQITYQIEKVIAHHCEYIKVRFYRTHWGADRWKRVTESPPACTGGQVTCAHSINVYFPT